MTESDDAPRVRAVTADLVTWLRAQLDEDERVAQAAIDGGPDDDGVWHRNHYCVEGAGINIYDEGGHSEDQAEHIAHWDPARVLDEVAAKRRILDYFDANAAASLTAVTMGEATALEHAVLYLAQPYAGRDGWREEWAIPAPTDTPG